MEIQVLRRSHTDNFSIEDIINRMSSLQIKTLSQGLESSEGYIKKGPARIITTLYIYQLVNYSDSYFQGRRMAQLSQRGRDVLEHIKKIHEMKMAQ